MSKTAKANVLACFLMLMQFLLILGISVFGEEIGSLFPAIMTAPGLLITNQLFSVFLPVVLFLPFVLRRGRSSMNAAEFMRFAPITGRNILTIVGMSLLIQPLMGALSGFSQLFFSNNIGALAQNISVNMSYIQMVTLLALFPAVFEELALRGAILGAYREFDERRAILLNGLFFGLIHLDGQQLLYAIAIGAFLAFIVLRTGSIFAGMIAHFTINGTQASLAYMLIKMLEAYDGVMENIPAESGAAQAGLAADETLTTATILFSILLVMAIATVSGIFFFKLLKRFSLHNPPPAVESLYEGDGGTLVQNDIAEHDVCAGEAEPPELQNLRLALKSEKSLTISFYISLFFAVAIYLAFMIFSGCSLPQMLFLLGILSAFFFILFFLRVGG